MSVEEQLQYESRVRARQVAFAVAAGILLMVGSVIGLLGYHAPVSEQTLNLIAAHRRGAQDLIAAIVNALAEVAIAATLVYLWRCTRARAPRAAVFIPVIAVVGAALAILAGVLNAVEISHKAHEFVTTGSQTYDEADRLTRGTGLLVLQIGGQVASLLVAIAFVLTSLQAMRVGLLPRMLGYVGIIAGALVLFPLIVVPIIQLYWLLAVAYLLSGRWPSGVPAAWRTGNAEAWPSSAELRARRVEEAEAARERRNERRAGRRGGGKRGAALPDDAGEAAVEQSEITRSEADAAARVAETEVEPPESSVEGETPRTRATTSKRKRKRRH